MSIVNARGIALGISLLTALGSAKPLHAQLGVGTWVRKAGPTAPAPAITMTVESCCGAGRRLIYRVDVNGTKMLLTLESAFDGREAPVLIDGKPTGETMAITRVDARHLSTVLKMNGTAFGTSKATLSADGRTLTVVNDLSTAIGGPVGKSTEIWVRQ